ncbi:MAG TPA: hypothetical protein VGH27_23525 [Streptosporangiaceae bacterium]|jgi:hypothetical protein
MSSPEETQLADDLHHLVAGQPFTTDLDAIERRARHLHHRGLALRSLAGVTVLGLAVAGGIAVSGGTARAGGTAHPGVAAARPAPAQVHTQTVAYVRQHIEAALNPANYVIETKQVQTSHVAKPSAVTIWTDPVTGNTMLLEGSGAAKVAYWEHDYYQDRVLHWYQTQVNYGPRTWWTYNMHAAGPIQGPVPPGPVGGDYTPAATVKTLLASGAWKIVGHPVLDGHPTVELSFSHGGLTSSIWADTTTYQVLRTYRAFPAQMLGARSTSTYYWIPRSPTMTTRINHPQIPPTYAKVPSP